MTSDVAATVVVATDDHTSGSDVLILSPCMFLISSFSAYNTQTEIIVRTKNSFYCTAGMHVAV